MNGKDIAVTLRPAGGWWQTKTEDLIERFINKLINTGMDPVDVQEEVGTLLIRLRAEYTAHGEA